MPLMLYTLGGLRLSGELVTRPKLLLLLVYLALEGTQNRRQLATLFWGSTQNPMLSLRLALSELRKTTGLIKADRQQVSTPLELDVVLFEQLLRDGKREAALELYRGPFLDGLRLSLEEELENWLIETRERLAQKTVVALLDQAEYHMASSDLALASKKAEDAYLLKAAPTPYGQTLRRLYQLLKTSQSALADRLEQDFQEELLNTQHTPELPVKSPQRSENPYRGLLAYRESDAPFFFGRDREIKELMERISQAPTSLCIVGNSGTGKSSLVFAGLIPQLRAQGWLIASMRPGRHPFSTLALSLLELSSDQSKEYLLKEVSNLAQRLEKGKLHINEILSNLGLDKARVSIFVDQAEELFSLHSTETITRFLQLFQHTHPQVLSLFTLRADYISALLSFPGSLSFMQDAQYFLRAIQGEALAKVISEPAKRQGVSFESGLIERILNDLAGQKSSLPLLAFSLMQLWEKHEDRLMKHQSYEAIGGISQALVRHAEESFAKLSPDEQTTAERVFLQLVKPGQGQADSKRVAYANEFNKQDLNVIDKLASYPDRLLVVGLDEKGETVELIHEALIENWERLTQWINTYRDFRSWQERFRQYLKLWQEQTYHPDLHLRGYLLQEAEQHFRERPDLLSSQEKRFIEQGLELRTLEIGKEEKQRQEKLNTLEQLAEKERNLRQADSYRLKTQRRFIRWLSVLGFVAVFFSLFALSARNAALSSNLRLIEKREQNQNLLAELLSEKAAVNQVNTPEQSLLLALEANARASTSRTQRITEAVLRQLVTETAGIRLAHSDRVLAADFSPQQGFFATAGRGNMIYIWKLEDVLHSPQARPLRSVESPGVDISALRFSPDGKWLVSSSFDGVLSIWKADQLPDLSLQQSFQQSDALLSADFSPDSRKFITASRNHLLSLWQLEESWTLESQSTDLAAPVQSVRFSPDGRFIAAGTNGETSRLFLWSSYDLSQINFSLTLSSGIRSLAFSPDLSYLAAGDQSGNIMLFDPQAARPNPRVLEAHHDLVVGLSFSPDQTWLASSSRDKTVKLWFLRDLEDQNLPRSLSLRGHEDKLAEGLVFSPAGDYLLSTGWDNAARLIDMTLPGPDLAILPLNSPARSIALSPRADHLALGDLQGHVYLYPFNHLNMPATLLGKHASWVEHLAFSTDGTKLVSSSDDSNGGEHTAVVWNLELNPPEKGILKTQQGTVYSASFGPQNTLLATAGEDHSVALWNLAKPDLPKILGKSEGIITDLDFQPNKQLFASSSFDGHLELFDIHSESSRHRLDLGEQLRAVAFSPDGHYVAAASWQGGAFLQELERLDQAALKIPSETGSSYALAFSHDSEWLAIGNDDATITLTRSQTPLETLTLHGHSDIVWSLSFSPDNQWLISASADGSLRYWQLSFDKVKSLACQKAGRNLSNKEWQTLFGTEPYHANCDFTALQAAK